MHIPTSGLYVRLFNLDIEHQSEIRSNYFYYFVASLINFIGTLMDISGKLKIFYNLYFPKK
jgi:hypothetical protein